MRKNLLPIMMIAVFGLLSFGSCKKKSSSNTCTCKERNSFDNADTTVSFSAVDTPYTSLSQECSAFDALEKAVLGSGYGCHM
jgi:hypothetical protein